MSYPIILYYCFYVFHIWPNGFFSSAFSFFLFNYNLSIIIRQKKNKFKKQEHQTFIDWFISVPAKITRSGHQIELKLYEHHFYKADWEEFDKLIEAA